MAVITTTDGKTYIVPTDCNCGLTGGCEKCHPYELPINYAGFEVPQKQSKEDRLTEIRKKSHEELKEAWEYLATH